MKKYASTFIATRKSLPRPELIMLGMGILLGGILLFAGCAGYQKKIQEQAIVGIESETGLKKVEVPGTEGLYLGKEYRGYRVLYTGKAGNVWGRYAARLTMGEIGREVGGVMAFLTSSYEYAGNVAGSPLDRLLAQVIGQPISITMILIHGKPYAPRLDIVGGYAIVKPEETLPAVKRLGIGPGTIYTRDKVFAQRLLANTVLIDRLDDIWGAYIRVDSETVSLFWAGQETDFSRMINDHDGYYEMLNAFLDDLADIADAIPTPAEERADSVE